MHPIITRRGILALAAQQGPLVWKFDNLGQIGGLKTRVEGEPKLVESGWGKAIRFGGEPDAIFVDQHPLAGAETFTWEAVFRPERGGKPEQRFFHLQEDGSQHRLLFETRLIEDRWCLDSFAATRTGSQTLIDRSKLHSLDEWHHVAMVYDGTEFRHYVDHQLQGAANVQLAPQGAGKTSLGVRINRIDYFQGSLGFAVFTRQALRPTSFRGWRQQI